MTIPADTVRPISFAIELCTKRFGKIATGVDEPVTQASANSVLIPVPVAITIACSLRARVVAAWLSATPSARFTVASLLAHPEFQITDSDVAAAVLVSGVYRARGRQRGGKILFRRGCEPIRSTIGVPRHPEHQDTAAACLVDARSPAPRR